MQFWQQALYHLIYHTQNIKPICLHCNGIIWFHYSVDEIVYGAIQVWFTLYFYGYTGKDHAANCIIGMKCMWLPFESN